MRFKDFPGLSWIKWSHLGNISIGFGFTNQVKLPFFWERWKRQWWNPSFGHMTLTLLQRKLEWRILWNFMTHYTLSPFSSRGTQLNFALHTHTHTRVWVLITADDVWYVNAYDFLCAPPAPALVQPTTHPPSHTHTHTFFHRERFSECWWRRPWSAQHIN